MGEFRMSKRFFTSDWHLNQSNIGQLNRNFKSVERMGEVFIKTANQMAKNRDDIIIHVGDFYCYGSDQGSESIKIHPSQYIKNINATFVNVMGNHDKSNKVLSVGSLITTNIGPYLNCCITHHPSNDHNSKVYYRKNLICICGHVHSRWKYFYDTDRNILNINVGVDVWKYRIVPETKLVDLINDIASKNKLVFNLTNKIRRK